MNNELRKDVEGSFHGQVCLDGRAKPRTLSSGYLISNFEVRHPRCVSNKSNYKVYAYIVRHNYVLGGMLFTVCKAQLRVSAINVGHLQVVQLKLIDQIYMHF